MEKFKTFVRLIISMLLSIVSVFLCGFIYLNDGSVQVWNTPSLVESSPSHSATKEPPKATLETKEPDNETSSSSEENISTKDESVTVGTDAQTALGAITRQFIGANTANLAIDNLHVKNSTGLNIDLKAELLEPIKFKVEKNSNPQVLIIHTHATESYMLEDRDY